MSDNHYSRIASTPSSRSSLTSSSPIRNDKASVYGTSTPRPDTASPPPPQCISPIEGCYTFHPFPATTTIAASYSSPDGGEVNPCYDDIERQTENRMDSANSSYATTSSKANLISMDDDLDVFHHIDTQSPKSLTSSANAMVTASTTINAIGQTTTTASSDPSMMTTTPAFPHSLITTSTPTSPPSVITTPISPPSIMSTTSYDGSQWHGYSTCERMSAEDGDGPAALNVNYHEAAIFVHEGENNDKFTAHPTNLDELPAYLITHRLCDYISPVCAFL